jgi:hypothetical protein
VYARSVWTYCVQHVVDRNSALAVDRDNGRLAGDRNGKPDRGVLDRRQNLMAASCRGAEHGGRDGFRRAAREHHLAARTATEERRHLFTSRLDRAPSGQAFGVDASRIARRIPQRSRHRVDRRWARR